MDDLLWGIDLGGTKIEGVVLRREDLSTIARERIPTETSQGYEHVIARIEQLLAVLRDRSGASPAKLGLGHPGAIDQRTSLIKNANSTCLIGKALQRDLESRLNIPVCAANDANCFALAEARLGAARGARSVFGVILGTGVGGGIVLDGRVHGGLQSIAGEWGHNILVESGPACYCGKSGCVEALISGPALAAYYTSRSGRSASFAEIASRTASDAVAEETVRRLVSYFGRAIAAVINILDPEVIVLGGGVSNVERLYTEGQETAQRFVFNDRFETVIVRHALGDSAGVFGAALLTQ